MLATPSGVMAGSVSGGCVEGATAVEIASAIERGTPKLVTFGVSDEKAWEVGLACGGTIKVLVQPAVPPEVLAAARGPGGEIVATRTDGPQAGRTARVYEDGRVEGALAESVAPDALAAAALDALRRERSATVSLDTPAGAADVFLEVYPRRPKLVIFGGVHIATALVSLARLLGYRTIVADGRQAFLTRERFPDADELILAWPGEAFERIGLDSGCYVCILSHDPKFDEPALRLALRSTAAYIGAIGSKKTQIKRREWLRSEGFSEADIAGCTAPSGSTSAAAIRRRRRWRFWPR
jgi:xanthine dehydrogenase accessory factor